MKALDPAKYEVVQIGITPNGQWLTGEAMLALSAPSSDATALVFVRKEAAAARAWNRNTRDDLPDAFFFP